MIAASTYDGRPDKTPVHSSFSYTSVSFHYRMSCDVLRVAQGYHSPGNEKCRGAVSHGRRGAVRYGNVDCVSPAIVIALVKHRAAASCDLRALYDEEQHSSCFHCRLRLRCFPRCRYWWRRATRIVPPSRVARNKDDDRPCTDCSSFYRCTVLSCHPE